MKKLLIKGGNAIDGNIRISGAKNSALPIMAASLLTKGNLTLNNIPYVDDVTTMATLLSHLGVNITLRQNEKLYGKTISINSFKINNYIAPYNLVKKMRASILVLGPLLARIKKVRISLPGGCAIGVRPIDLHIKAMEKMGAKINLVNGYIEATSPEGLRGAEIKFEKLSVGATENVIMAACLAKGETVIYNFAKEPEVVDLIDCLKKMGALIKVEDNNFIKIQGVSQLYSAEHSIISDRIEAGTYAVAAAITKGKVVLSNISNYKLCESFFAILKKINVSVEENKNGDVEINARNRKIKSFDIVTNPYPGFPTDMQAQFMSLATLSDGKSTIKESIFENRFMHILELVRMGADIKYEENIATINGVKQLLGAEVMATDLRASVSLVLAGLAAKGQTIINRVYHLERGYEKLVDKLSSCNADIKILQN